MVAAMRQCTPIVGPFKMWKALYPDGTYLPDAGTRLESNYSAAEAWAAADDAAINQEQACRMTRGCVAARNAARAKADLEATVGGICEFLSRRAEDVREIAREKANPSGVVDLNVLHVRGGDIQWIDDQLIGLKNHYAALVHKPFALAVCPK